MAPFLDVNEKGQDALVRENFTQVTHCIRAAVPLMTTGRGSIINITSIEAHRAGPGFAVYSAMKAALENLTKSLALELGERMIRVNCIAPDVIPTPGIGDLPVKTPLPRAGHVDDVAGAARVPGLGPGAVRHRRDPARRRRQLGRRRLAAGPGPASRRRTRLVRCGRGRAKARLRLSQGPPSGGRRRRGSSGHGAAKARAPYGLER